MKQRDDELEIRQELSKFINLLQGDFKQTFNGSSERVPQDSSLSKKLSVIFSASQPESSSLDKENSNPSANRSFETNEKGADSASRQGLVQSLLATNLTPAQQRLLEKIKEYIQQLKLQNERTLTQLQEIRKELASQKYANDEVLSVLVKLDQQQKQLWNNYNIASAKYQQANQKNKQIEGEFQRAKESLLALQNDNDFMKKLIFHANENYQSLERRCGELESERERSSATTDRKSVKKSSMDHLLKSAKTKKNGYSPSHSEVLRSASPQNFNQIYRKMIIRTLKFKGRSGYHM